MSSGKTMFEKILNEMGWMEDIYSDKYCRVGKTYKMKTEAMNGLYWFYETDYFIVEIHDFMVLKEMIAESFPDMSSIFSFNSSYIKSANGECFYPYQTLSSNTMFVTSMLNANFRYLLHANFPYLSVGIGFKEKMLQESLPNYNEITHEKIKEIFIETRELITQPMEKIANSIINCNMESPAAELFFEAKAKEWLSITINSYLHISKESPMSAEDEKAIENVSNYINDHLSLDIHQDILEKIAMMSGTKLKKLFKQKYRMTITEYTQRKRMNIAETLLSTTEIDISNIAKTVGYSSHSRFTTLFKKYKGIYPKEIRKLTKEK